jgi:acetyl esterase
VNLEPKARAFVEMLQQSGLPPMWTLTPQEARESARALKKPVAPRPLYRVRDEALSRHDAPALPVRIYEPSPDPAALILYFHGGGWTVGGIEESDAFTRELSATTGCAVASVDYRLAPEAPFPAAVQDGVDALLGLGLARQRLFNSKIPLVVAGDSAGANIATVASRLSLQTGGPRPDAQILAYPVTDCAMATESYTQFADGPLLTRRMMEWFWANYVPAQADRPDPRASCLRATDLSGMPATFILTAENDVLRDEGEAYAQALARAGTPVRLKRYAGQIHGFVTLTGMFDGGQRALNDIADFVTESVAPGKAARHD